MGDHHVDWCQMDARNHFVQKLARGGVNLVRVFDDEEYRRTRCCEERTIDERSERDLLSLLCRKAGQVESITEVQREELGIDRSALGRVLPIVRQQAIQF